MTVIFRTITILITCCRYRLDTLLPNHLPWPIRFFCTLFPNRFQNRGKQLRLACEHLGPIFVKFGQLLSTRPDLIPPDIVKELDHLQDNVTPFAPEAFRDIVIRELGKPIEVLFAEFEEQPLGSASVAQVHGAALKDGRKVVVKVIRPGIDDILQKDIQLLLWIARKLEKWLPDGPRFKPVDVVKDYRNTIFDELNLQREAANASQLRRNFLHSPLLYVPEIYWDYCSQHVLVMERIDGVQITDIDTLKAQNTNIPRLAERGVAIFFTQVFEHNFFHADMHPGNIFVSRQRPDQPQYIAVDMAIVGSLTREDQYYLARNLLAMFRRDYRQVAELHIDSGWVPEDTKVNELEAAVRTVCEPIFEKPLAEISFGKVMISLFATARRFNMEVQPQLVLLQKTLLNIEGLGRQLYPELDLWKTARPYLERWLKNRYSPKAIFSELKRKSPEWLEKFPDAPIKILNHLDRLEQLSDIAPALQQAADDYHQYRIKKKQHGFKIAVVTGLIIAALVSAWPLLTSQMDTSALLSLGLIVAAIITWLIG